MWNEAEEEPMVQKTKAKSNKSETRKEGLKKLLT